MARMFVWALMSFVVMAACGSHAELQCEQNSVCDLGIGGVCTALGTGHSWCAYPDPGCQSGYRFSNQQVGDGVSGACVAVDVDAGVAVDSGGDEVIPGLSKRGPLIDYLPPTTGSAYAGTPTIVGNGVWSFSSINDRIAVPIRVRQGERLLKVRTKVSCGVNTVIDVVFGQNDPDAQTGDQPRKSSLGHSGATENIDHDMSIPAASSALMTLILAPSTFSGPAFFRGVEITTDVP